MRDPRRGRGAPGRLRLDPRAALNRRTLLGAGAGGLAASALATAAWLGTSPAPAPAPGTPRPTRHRYGRHPRQVGDLSLPPGEVAGTVVMLHGGFWQAGFDLTLHDAVAADLAARGFAVWNLDYRPVGDGGGWPATFDDVRAGVAHLAGLPGPGAATDPVLLGHSAGGHLAAWVAGEDTGAVRPRAVLPMAGVLALTAAARAGLGGGAVSRLLGGDPDRVPARYAAADPIRRPPLAVPVRAVHGRDDTVVPVRQSRRYVAAATAAGADAALLLTPGGHFDALDPATPMWRRTVTEISRLHLLA